MHTWVDQLDNYFISTRKDRACVCKGADDTVSLTNAQCIEDPQEVAVAKALGTVLVKARLPNNTFGRKE